MTDNKDAITKKVSDILYNLPELIEEDIADALYDAGLLTDSANWNELVWERNQFRKANEALSVANEELEKSLQLQKHYDTLRFEIAAEDFVKTVKQIVAERNKTQEEDQKITEFQTGDVVYVSEDARYTAYGRIKDWPSGARGMVATVSSPAVDEDWDVCLDSGHTDGPVDCVQPEYLTLVGGPRMKFRVGDVVDVAEDATVVGTPYVSTAAGRRGVVEYVDASIGLLNVNAEGDPNDHSNPETKYLTLVKREGYIDRTEKVTDISSATSTLDRVRELADKWADESYRERKSAEYNVSARIQRVKCERQLRDILGEVQ